MDKIKNMVIIVVLANLLVSCIQGTYISKEKNIKIELNKDNRFIYDYSFRVAGEGIFEGTWLKNNDTIRLITDKKYYPKHNITENQNSDSNDIIISVVEKGTTEPLVGATIVINDKSYITDIKGLVICEQEEINNISISYVKTINFTIDNKKANGFDIAIDVEKMRPDSIYPENTWIIEKSKLKSLDGKFLYKETNRK